MIKISIFKTERKQNGQQFKTIWVNKMAFGLVCDLDIVICGVRLFNSAGLPGLWVHI